MRDLRTFFAQNMKPMEKAQYPATARLIDPETNEPALWEITPISADENIAIRRSCLKLKQVPGKKGQFTQDFDANAYLVKMAVRCTSFPNLNDRELQDDWGVMDAEQLLGKMLSPAELEDYANEVLRVNGFNDTERELVEEAKN